MAKLSANGRKELLRLVREEGTPRTDGWKRWTRAYMDDRVVLEKYDYWEVRQYGTSGIHSFGWKRVGKLKETVELAALKRSRIGLGWKEVV